MSHIDLDRAGTVTEGVAAFTSNHGWMLCRRDARSVSF